MSQTVLKAYLSQRRREKAENLEASFGQNLQDRGQFAQVARGVQNANETSKLVSSFSGSIAPRALIIGRLRHAEPLERTKDLRGFLWV
jgi:hypothetical protein